MPQQVRVRRLTQVTYGASQTRGEQLPKGMLLRELILRLSGSVTAAAGFALTDLTRGDEWGIVRRIQIIANGSDVLLNLDGCQLAYLNYFLTGGRRAKTAWAAGVVAFDTCLVVPIWSFMSKKSMDTILDTRLLSDLRLEITWGTITDISTHAADAITVNPIIDAYGYESFGIEGPFSQSRLFRIIHTTVAANTAFRVNLPVGHMYHGFLLNTQTTGCDTALINNIRLIAGSTVFYDLPGTVCQQWFRRRYGFEQIQDNALGFYEPNFYSDQNFQAGWYYVDLVGDGYLSEAVDTLGLAELYLELNIAAASTLEVIPMQIIPVRSGK